MHRPLLLVGGALNTLLALFHVFLGWKIHHFPGLAPGYKALMEMLNAGGTLMIVLFAVASLACVEEMLSTRLGKLMLGCVFAVYFSRAVEEIIVSPRFSPGIFAVCLLIAVVYLMVLVVPVRIQRPRAAAVSETP
jgi:hypothetical protein